ncbi:MAG: hypothetical protein N2316_08280 [Spirochaetes bacterium]|nr:hypothetical protein [Spirochaetota bacterium]
MNVRTFFQISVYDLLTIVGYAVIPALVHILLEQFSDSLIMHYYLGIASMILYPMFCIAMVQTAVDDAGVRKGFAFLHRAMWRFFSWPFGVLFYLALLFHGSFAWMGITWGELVYGDAFFEMLFQDKNYDMFGDPFYLGALAWTHITSMVFVKRLFGIRIKKYLPYTIGGLIFFLIIVFPLLAVLGGSIFLVLPPYLIAIAWGYLSLRSFYEEPIVDPFPKSTAVRSGLIAVIWLYGILMSYFFRTAIDVFQRTRAEASWENWFGVVIVFFMFYVPIRFFVALFNRQNIFGWITFALVTAFVCYDVFVKFYR